MNLFLKISFIQSNKRNSSKAESGDHVIVHCYVTFIIFYHNAQFVLYLWAHFIWYILLGASHIIQHVIMFYQQNVKGDFLLIYSWLIYSICHQTEPPDLFQWGCSPASYPQVCKYIQGCPVPGVESSSCSCYVSYSWWLPNRLICQDTHARPFYSQGSQQLLPI